MDLQLTPIVRVTAQRMIGACADGSLRLVWGDAMFRIPAYELTHLAAALDTWEAAEELPEFRRGYYRLQHGADGAILLWLNNAAICLSRDDLRALSGLVRLAEACLHETECTTACAPFGKEYRTLAGPCPARACLN
jgi:hypothetical protein